MGNLKDFERKIVSVNLPIDVLEKLDKYANKLHINRSAAITSLLVQGLEQSTAIEIMSKLMDKYETLEQLKSIDNDDF